MVHSNQTKIFGSRFSRRSDNTLDLLRGIAVLDMVLVHFSIYFTGYLNKIFLINDIAIDGFILISGYTIGNFLLPVLKNNFSLGFNKILIRIFKISLIHLFLVATVGIFQFLTQNPTAEIYSVLNFFFKTLFSINQIGLFHILPIFIKLYCLSTIILVLIINRLSVIVVLFSALCFIIGLKNPFFFTIGSPAIFPIALWQAYFIIGIFLGKHGLFTNTKLIRSNLFVLGMVFLTIVSFTIRNAAFISTAFQENLYSIGLAYSKFPLNISGLIFGVSVWVLIAILHIYFFDYIHNSFYFTFLCSLGRNALFAFFTHIFLAKIIEILLHVSPTNIIFAYIIIAINIFLFVFIVPIIDRYLSMSRDNVPFNFFVYIFS